MDSLILSAELVVAGLEGSVVGVGQVVGEGGEEVRVGIIAPLGTLYFHDSAFFGIVVYFW